MPNFLLVGTAFSGAETLLDWLGHHPQIQVSPIRETNYFVSKDLGTEGVHDAVLLNRPRLQTDGEYERTDVARITTRRDYERCFLAANKPGGIRFGEASPAYLFYPEAARRIAKAVPHAKIVMVLRDPVERASAHHAAFMRAGKEHLNLATALGQEKRRLSTGWAYHWAYGALSEYTVALKRYLAHFPLPQIHLVRAEDLQSEERRPAAWRALLAFLKVDANVSLPDSARLGKVFPPVGAPEAADDARRALVDRLQCETEFYRNAFSETPFRQAALRHLAEGVQKANGALPSDGKPDVGTVFQHVLFTKDMAREALYHRRISHGVSVGPRLSQSGQMNFLKDDVVSFDGYFNAFFESMVAERTGLSSIQLHLDLTGRFYVEILRFAQGRDAQLVAGVMHDGRSGSEPFALEVELASDNPLGSRLAFHLTCLSKQGQFIGGRWWTTAAPRRAVQLDILACTYKKHEFIERTVRRIVEYPRLNRDEYFITVTDNASDLPADLFPYPNVQIVPQGNVGGAGGAARGLMEGLSATDRARPTHFLLLDDDIEMEPDMVLRAMSWLRYVKVDQCIGGGMLDLYRPTHLHELGAKIGHPKVLDVSACISALELAPLGALDRLGHIPESHYNAWWFMAISREAVEKHGLPLPCFIRGDDKEFGYRMLKQGIPTLAVPGVAVWHLPFYAKIAAWLYYYNMYNDLLIRALRYPEITTDALMDAVEEEIKHYLDKLEYDQAAMRIRGLEHFLLGPQWLLETDVETRFKEAVFASKEYAPLHRREVEPSQYNHHYEPKSKFDRRWRRWMHNGHLTMKWRKPAYTTSGLPRKVLRIGDWSGSDVTYFDEVGVKHALVPGIYIFRKQPDVYFALFRRAQAALKTLRREWPQRAAEFRQYDAEFTSTSFWRRHLHIDEAMTKVAAPNEDLVPEPPEEAASVNVLASV